MKKILLIGSFLGLFAVEIAWAQVGVGTTLPDGSAQLDVVSNNKGVLLPRVSLTGTGDTATITNPATSLIVYNMNTVSDVTSGFYFWNGTVWERLRSGDSSRALSVEPTIAVAGETYYNINENKFYVSNGMEWYGIDSDRLAYGKMLLGDATGKAAEVTMSGDVVMDNTGAVTIANGAVTTAKISDANVTSAKIADNSVTTAKIGTLGATDADRILTTDSMGDPQWEDKGNLLLPSSSLLLTNGQVYVGNGSNIAFGVALSGDIAMDNTGAVTIANGAVTTAKISDANVTSAKIADNSVTIAKMGALGSTGGDRILTTDSGGDPQWENRDNLVSSSLTNGQVYVGNGSNVASGVVLSGDITMNNTGAVTIANGVVTTDKIGTSGSADADRILTTDSAGNPQWEDKTNTSVSASSLSLATGKVYVGDGSGHASTKTLSGDITMDNMGVVTIADEAVTSDKIDDEAVTSDKIADEAVTSDKIADEAVTSDKIADNSVTSAKISDGAIVDDDVNANAAIAGSKISADFRNQTVIAGNISIVHQNFGLSSPHINLDGGDLRVVDDAEIGGNLWVDGTFYSPSDKRLKKNIKTLTSALAKINQLRGVYYQYKDQQKYAAGPQIGLIAQELQKVFPEFVKKGADGYLAVNYSQLTAVVIQAVKEQQKEINLLKTRMQRVEKELGF